MGLLKNESNEGLWKNNENDFDNDQDNDQDNFDRKVYDSRQGNNIQTKLKKVSHFGEALGLLKDELRSINFNRTNAHLDIN